MRQQIVLSLISLIVGVFVGYMFWHGLGATKSRAKSALKAVRRFVIEKPIPFYLIFFFLLAAFFAGHLLTKHGVGTALFEVARDGATSDWFWAMTQAFTVLISLVAIYRQVRLQNDQLVVQNEQLKLQNDSIQLQGHSNMLQQLTNLRSIWTGAEMRKFRRVVCEEYKSQTDPNLLNGETEVLNFFEEIGVLLKNKIVPAEILWEIYTHHVEHMWPILVTKVSAYRKANDDDDTYFENCQKLWEAMVEESKNRLKDKLSVTKTKADLDRYVEQELKDLAEPTDGGEDLWDVLAAFCEKRKAAAEAKAAAQLKEQEARERAARAAQAAQAEREARERAGSAGSVDPNNANAPAPTAGATAPSVPAAPAEGTQTS